MAESHGLYYMRARYYDPEVGRFINKDPIGYLGWDINLFAYVGNNPVNWADPYGLFNPTKGIAALANAANAGRLYASGLLRLGVASGLISTGIGTPGSVVTGVWGLWNIRAGMVAQNRGLLLWKEAFEESWSDASWKNLLGVLPYGEKYDDPCEPSFFNFWRNYEIENWWQFIGEIGFGAP
jgi:type VI secretion system secreted protein VgrG